MPLNDKSQIRYNDPLGGTSSDIGPQVRTDYWHKKALVEAVKEQYFTQLASTKNMPKHYGKQIKVYHMIPLLDDRNINDQGIDAAGAVIANGNLYGSSKDVGTITGKIPSLTETGGRVNRVGFTRLLIEGAIEKQGFFMDFSQEALDLDSQDDLYEYLSSALIDGANEITEDMLQIDLLNDAGVVRFFGVASQDSEIIGEGPDISEISYNDLQRMSIDLDNNRTPKQTKIITGSRMVDTNTVNSGRILYCGSEMIPTFTRMTDFHGNAAFVSVEHYAHANDYKKGVNMVHGEIGKVGDFRIVVVPEMMHWAGAGAAVTNNAGYNATGSNYDVFPLLCVGSESFTTIGFKTSGEMVKFKIITKMPGVATADHSDPYGEVGFSSIKWWYGFMALRPERIALAKSVARI